MSWCAFWLVLSVLHVTQAIWLSGGRAYPGDLGDGRFNELVLEHGFQAIRGRADWSSPGQFYPTSGTLAYSDTHAGTLPIYAGLRMLSISREEAWQLWFVIVAALNVVAAYRLFSALGIGAWLRGPLVFASAASAAMVWAAGTHMQMLPLFPALLAAEQAILWIDDRGPWRPAACLGWLAWQFAAGLYVLFFTLVIGLGVGISLMTVGGHRPGPKATRAPRRRWMVAVLILAAGTLLALKTLTVYVPYLHGGQIHDLSEAIDLAPSPSSWFASSPVWLLYPESWPVHQANLVELGLFAGVLPWILLPILFLEGWRHRAAKAGAWALALGLGFVGTMLFFTKWSESESGAWLFLARHCDQLRAFRAAGRVAVLLRFPIMGAFGLLFTRWQLQMQRRWIFAATVGLACLLAAENLSFHQPSTLLSVARARTSATIAAWRKAGDRPVLAFAPGFNNQPESVLSLDAWSAALQLHRVTINGTAVQL